MEKEVLYERNEQGYGVITLNRPEKRNAISASMAKLIKASLETALHDDLKFLVITAAGDRVFCAGGDLTELHGELSNEEAFIQLTPMREILAEIVQFPVPVIALLNGNGLGGGCELAAACDIRIAKENTKFGFVQSNIGILPGWGGGAILYKKINPTFAINWLSTGQVYNADDLHNIGFLQLVVSNGEFINREKLLEPWIRKSVTQMRLLKKQFLRHIHGTELPELMIAESKNTASLWDSKEHIEAVASFLAKK